MNKEEFIKEYSDKGHRSDPQYGWRTTTKRWSLDKVHDHFDAVPCDCGAIECEGWKMHIKGMEPPPDCGNDPMTWNLPFGPPFTMMDETNEITITPRNGVASGQLGEGGEFFPIGEDDSPPLVLMDAPPDSGVASKEPMKIAGMDLPFHWHFILDGETVGELWFNDDTKRLTFTGNAGASAQILFDLVTDQFEAWHKDKYGE